MNKRITIALAFAFILLLSVVFRSKIGQFISLQGSEQGGEQVQKNSPLPSSSPASTPGASQAPIVSSMPRPVPSQFPVYKGRPVEEVRADPEEVKLFSESQKQDMYRALQNFGKSVRENPDTFNSWIQLGLLKKVIGDYEGARDAWEYAGVIRPQNDISFANLGELYWHYLHDFNRSESNFKTAIKNNPNDPGTYASLSDVYFYSLKSKANLAEDILFQGIAVNPKSINLLKKLANLYERQGEYAKAIEQWQKVLAQDPHDQNIAAAIEALKKKLGQQ